MRIDGQGAIITGSATGLGAAIAIKLAKRGANVVINFTKSKAEAEEIAKLCEEAGKDAGVKALLVQADVTKDEDCRRMASEAYEAFGRIDMLINNAGGTKFADHAKMDELNAEDFHWIYDLNVVGPYQMIRACLPHLKENGKGKVVNVSSIAGVAGIGSSVAYAASKGALNTMTISLARSLAPEVRVNAICPGFIGTRWFKDKFGDNAYQAIVADQEATMPLRQAGTPELVADSAVFFACEGGDNITGEMLITDAGMHLGYAPLKAR